MLVVMFITTIVGIGQNDNLGKENKVKKTA
jgi:hypothetical protein